MTRSSLVALSLLCCAVMLLAGCERMREAGAEAAMAEEAPEGCAVPPFAKVLPTAKDIHGKPLRYRECDAVNGHAFYGSITEDGDADQGCDIELTDLGFENPAGSKAMGTDAMFQHSRTVGLGMWRASMDLLVETRKTALADPVILNALGGPQHLPVVDKTSTGETYVIAVPGPRDAPGSEALLSLVHDRYTVRISCSQAIANHDEAKALYSPWLASLRLGELP